MLAGACDVCPSKPLLLFHCEVEVMHIVQEVVLCHSVRVQSCKELFCLVHYFLSLSYMSWPDHTVIARNENISEFVSGSGVGVLLHLSKY
jgi:hypothetical protein